MLARKKSAGTVILSVDAKWGIVVLEELSITSEARDLLFLHDQQTADSSRQNQALVMTIHGAA